jgi:hypothetical protein
MSAPRITTDPDPLLVSGAWGGPDVAELTLISPHQPRRVWLARFAHGLRTVIKAGRDAHTFSHREKVAGTAG